MARPHDKEPSPKPLAQESPDASVLSFAPPETLAKLVSRGNLNDGEICLLLDRKDLPGAVLGEIVRNRALLRSYRVKRALAFHPHVPRTLALRLIRDLYTADLLRLSLAPAAVVDLRRIAEDQLLARAGQLALGEKIALAKQASGRVIAALIAEGNRRVIGPALQNPRLTEAQVLKLLAMEKLPAAVVSAIAMHPRWQPLPNARLALIRHPATPPELAVKLLALAPASHLKTLHGLKTLSAGVKQAIERELAHRERGSKL